MTAAAWDAGGHFQGFHRNRRATEEYPILITVERLLSCAGRAWPYGTAIPADATAPARGGERETDHDLSGLKGLRLRTHGSLHEADVPIILSRPVSDEYARRAEGARLHSYEAFDYAFNGPVD